MSAAPATATETLPLGVVVAGGLGRRMGRAKAVAQLHGRPLISYPLEALRAALAEVVVLAKPDTELPDLPGQAVWLDPYPAHHPLVGIRAALERAGGRTVLVCAVDLPLISPGFVLRLAHVAGSADSASAVVSSYAGAIQPLLACYRPDALAPLIQAGVGSALRAAVRALGPRLVEVDDPRELFNVNTPADLARAAALLEARRR